MENFMNRLLCVVLSMSILIPGLNLESISASAETVTSRFELEPMPNGSSISDNDAQNEMISEVLDEPDVNVKSNKKKNNWWLLYHYDHLAYGEIHWRVQNDILYIVDTHILINIAMNIFLKWDFTERKCAHITFAQSRYNAWSRFLNISVLIFMTKSFYSFSQKMTHFS